MESQVTNIEKMFEFLDEGVDNINMVAGHVEGVQEYISSIEQEILDKEVISINGHSLIRAINNNASPQEIQRRLLDLVSSAMGDSIAEAIEYWGHESYYSKA